MMYSSAELNKELKKLKREKDFLLRKETDNAVFIVEKSENVENVRPEFNFEENSDEILEINIKIISIKHELNLFNIKTILPCGLSIDRALIYLPMLKERADKFKFYAQRPANERLLPYESGNFIQYRCINYDSEWMKEEYDALMDLITTIQLELDEINNKKLIEFNLEDE